MPAELTLEVPDDAAGMRLDRFLAVPLGSRARAQSLIEAERVLVDGRVCRKRHAVRAGERVSVEEDGAAPGAAGVSASESARFSVAFEEDGAAPGAVGVSASESARFSVAFEDPWLLVVDKPAGVVVHPARGHRTGTLAQALAGRGAGGGDEAWRAGIVHRLDRDTSGLLVVARNDEVHRALKRVLAARGLQRQYLALVDGHPPARSGTIDAPIGRHRRDRVLMSIDTDDPREARTHYEIERLFADSSLLRVSLETGRTHQIRVHMAAIGHPVSGDPQYGVAGRFGLGRQFLHAARLAFVHPMTGDDVDVSSPLPEDLARALEVAAGAG